MLQKAKDLKDIQTNLLNFVETSHTDYKAAWFHRALCTKLEQFIEDVQAGRNPRLMIMMPPRHGKSFIASERFPMWVLGNWPSAEIIVSSYSQDQASRFSRRARGLTQMEWVREIFPRLRLSKTKETEWETTQGGAYRAVGVGGSITGSGANIFIIDDPVKNHLEAYSQSTREKIWEWFGAVCETRLMPQSGIILIMTRWHHDDLAGRLLATEKDKWQILKYPAIATYDEQYRKTGEALHPERFSLDRLEEIKARGGWIFQALYQQEPVDTEGSIFKPYWWQFYETVPAHYDELIQSWDMAFKETGHSDYVVGQVWARSGENFYLLDQVRGRMDFSQTLKAVKSLSHKWPSAWRKLIEDKANGPAVISALEKDIGGLTPVTPQGGKLARAMAIQALLESSQVFLPLPDSVSWINEFIQEACDFPLGAHDDQVDAMTQALIYFLQHQSQFFVGLG